VHPADRVRPNRIAFILVLLIVGWPVMSYGIGYLKKTFVDEPPARAVARQIAESNVYNAGDPRAGLTCIDHVLMSGWHFVCTVALDPNRPDERVKFGVDVLIDGRTVQWVSKLHPLSVRQIER
jgi:hypothetical protein